MEGIMWYITWWPGTTYQVTFFAPDGKTALDKADKLWGGKGANVESTKAPRNSR
jgi:hypothetical protein